MRTRFSPLMSLQLFSHFGPIPTPPLEVFDVTTGCLLETNCGLTLHPPVFFLENALTYFSPLTTVKRVSLRWQLAPCLSSSSVTVNSVTVTNFQDPFLGLGDSGNLATSWHGHPSWP